jgi:hypothetical protein
MLLPLPMWGPEMKGADFRVPLGFILRMAEVRC